MPRRRRPSFVVAPLSLLAVIVIAACGGAVDNSDLFNKKGTTTTSGTPTATATATTTTPPTAPTTSPPVPQPKPGPQACSVSFATDVMQVFAQTSCAEGSCHGKVNVPLMNPASPAQTYKSLITFTMSTGQEYVSVGSTNPKASGIFCNLRDNCGVGMPLGDKLTSQQLDVIDAWLACGAPLN